MCSYVIYVERHGVDDVIPDPTGLLLLHSPTSFFAPSSTLSQAVELTPSCYMPNRPNICPSPRPGVAGRGTCAVLYL